MILKGVAILVVCLSLASPNDAFAVKKKDLPAVVKAIAKASNPSDAARRRDMNEAMTYQDTLRQLSNLDDEEYDEVMKDVASRLIKTFQPDAIMEVLDSLDSAARWNQNQETEDEAIYDEDVPIPVRLAG